MLKHVLHLKVLNIYSSTYAFKGTGCENVIFTVNEVQTCIDSRYVSSPEAL